MKWGEFELDLIPGGTFRLDGGAMFGVVPKTLWSRVTAPDDENRIPLTTNCLLLRSPETTVLIETGCGEKYSEKERGIYRMQHPSPLVANLAVRGVRPDRVKLVINTHLHFDHAGGNTVLHEGRPTATFPNARYVTQALEHAEANRPTERNAASYRTQDWKPLEESGQLDLVEGDTEVLPGVRLIPTPGHTRGHQSVLIDSGERQLLFIGDLCPTIAHVPLPWIMSFDLHPMTTLETRRALYNTILEHQWTVMFAHDPTHPVGELRCSGGRFHAVPVDFF